MQADACRTQCHALKQKYPGKDAPSLVESCLLLKSKQYSKAISLLPVCDVTPPTKISIPFEAPFIFNLLIFSLRPFGINLFSTSAYLKVARVHLHYCLPGVRERIERAIPVTAAVARSDSPLSRSGEGRLPVAASAWTRHLPTSHCTYLSHINWRLEKTLYQFGVVFSCY